jgi:hypothetical protein
MCGGGRCSSRIAVPSPRSAARGAVGLDDARLIRLRICPVCTAVTVAPDRHAAAHRAERERP